MYTLKNNKLPRLYLKFHKYKIKRKNKQVIWYQKKLLQEILIIMLCFTQ